MSIYIDVTTDGCLPLNELELCLDYPLCGFQDADSILIAGWVLPSDTLASVIRVIIRVVENQQTRDIETLSIIRPDVFKAKRPNESHTNDEMNVGFSTKIGCINNSVATVIIVKDGQELPWCHINITKSKCLTNFIKKIKQKSQLEELEELEIDAHAIEKHIKTYHSHTLNSFHRSVIHPYLNEFKRSVDDYSFIVSLYNSVSGKVRFSREKLNFNIYHTISSTNHNFLFCHHENGIPLIIHQYVTSCDGIYYPTKGVYYDLCHNSKSSVSTIISILLKRLDILSTQHIKETSFLVGHGRPYHFMYDSMLGLETIFSVEKKINNNANFYILNNHSFIDAPKIYNRNHSAVFVDNKTLSHLEKRGTLLIRLGALFGGGVNEPNKLEKLHSFDKKAIEYSIEFNSFDIKFAADLKKHFPIIWLGVTGQKRSWLEQIEGYASIINKLYKKFPGMAIVFDGWTAPIMKSKLDESETLNDQALVKEIELRIAKDITTINLVGSNIENKIYVGTMVDFAVVNRATGSMNISRICGRPCVTHLSNSFEFAAKQQHIHQNAHHIEKKLITDVDNNIGKVDHVSYHLNWMDIYDEIIKHVGSINFLEKRWDY